MACVAAWVGCLIPVQAWACGWHISCDIEILHQDKSASAKQEGSKWDWPMSPREEEKEKQKCLKKAQDIACKKLCREQLCEEMKRGSTERKACEKRCIADCNRDAATVESNSALISDVHPED